MEKEYCFLEKFALLNLLKAIDGLKSISNTEKETSTPASPPPQETTQTNKNGDLPNIMYEALMRHEIVSNRIRNKK